MAQGRPAVRCCCYSAISEAAAVAVAAVVVAAVVVAAVVPATIMEMAENLTDVVKVTVLEKRYTILVRRRKDRLATPMTAIKAKTKIVSPQEQEKGDVDQFGSHLGQLLNAVKKNGGPLKCIKGSDCKYKHGDSMSSQERLRPSSLRSCQDGFRIA